MSNFSPLAADISWRVWGTSTNFNGFASWQHYCTNSSSGRQPNVAALNRVRHLYSAGRPSRWALTDILVSSIFLFFPRLISAVADWMSAILPHMVWL